MTDVYAPWTNQQVAALRDYQTSFKFHPYTCKRCSDNDDLPSSILIPTTAGWVCPVHECGYTQDWAHSFSFELGDDDR